MSTRYGNCIEVQYISPQSCCRLKLRDAAAAAPAFLAWYVTMSWRPVQSCSFFSWRHYDTSSDLLLRDCNLSVRTIASFSATHKLHLLDLLVYGAGLWWAGQLML